MTFHQIEEEKEKEVYFFFEIKKNVYKSMIVSIKNKTFVTRIKKNF